MTTTPTSGAADLPEALRSIQRFEVVDCIDSKHVPAVIPNPHGPWVRYEDHIAALASDPAQPVAQQAMAYAALPEPLEIDWPELHSQALGCGVEDRGLHSRYECAEYGWQDGVDKCAERVPDQIFDADQMHAYADATCAARMAAQAAPADLLPVVDRLLVDAYSAGLNDDEFDMLSAKAKVAALFSDAQAAPVDAAKLPSPAAQVDAARLERERICAAIKAEDDYCIDQGDYMLDSDDCIKIVRGEWVRPEYPVGAARAAQEGKTNE